MALIATALAANPAWALPSCPVAPATIPACCIADQAGQHYVVASDLPATHGCFKISARNVVFDLRGHVVTGSNKGIGIHVLSTAVNAVVGNGSVEQFATGLKSDAPYTTVTVLKCNLNGRGIVFNASANFGLVDTADQSENNGIILTPAASYSYLAEVETEDNNGNGVVLRGTRGATLRFVTSLQNLGYGLWLKGASFNTVEQADLEGNRIAGAYLGCHPDGPHSAACAIPPSNGNTIDGDGITPYFVVGSCPKGVEASQPYGIAIDKGNRHNRVLQVQTSTDSSCASPGDTIYDGYDGNGARCGGNIWGDNSLTTENHTLTPEHEFCMQ